MRTSDFDYELPRELIATHPADKRDESRLLILDRATGQIEHRQFHNLVDYLQPGDLLVMNDTRVMKARLRGERATTGAGVEVLLLNQEAEQGSSERDTSVWTAFCRPAKKFRVGETVVFAGGQLKARVLSEGEEGQRALEFDTADIMPWLEKYGEIPLPPYIVQRRKEMEAEGTGDAEDVDIERYQTVYAREGTSVAAPTAGLHFTPDLLNMLKSRGVEQAFVTLHVGAGTFKPVEVEDPREHPIHMEYYEIPAGTAELIEHTRAAGGRIIAVGTTTVRALESGWNAEAGRFQTGAHSTRLLILPGYKFAAIDGMITNFHLPRSSLLMMVSALAGFDNIMAAYREAIAEKYRFYSYGDAMLILPK